MKMEKLNGSSCIHKKGSGGPKGKHTHSDNYIFIVTQGEARVVLGDKSVIVKKTKVSALFLCRTISLNWFRLY